jgi:hypothetical protein
MRYDVESTGARERLIEGGRERVLQKQCVGGFGDGGR